MKIISTINSKSGENNYIVQIDESEKKLLDLQKSARVRKSVRLALDKIAEANTALATALRHSLEYWNVAYPRSALKGIFKDLEINPPAKKRGGK